MITTETNNKATYVTERKKVITTERNYKIYTMDWKINTVKGKHEIQNTIKRNKHEKCRSPSMIVLK